MKVFNKDDMKEKRMWHYTGGKTPEHDGVPVLIETDERLELDSPFIANGTAYALIGRSYDSKGNDWGLAERLPVQDVFVHNEHAHDQFGSDYVKCPYCGYEEPDSFELRDSDERHICGTCGSIFSYQREIAATYNSSPVQKAEVVVLD